MNFHNRAIELYIKKIVKNQNESKKKTRSEILLLLLWYQSIKRSGREQEVKRRQAWQEGRFTILKDSGMSSRTERYAALSGEPALPLGVRRICDCYRDQRRRTCKGRTSS